MPDHGNFQFNGCVKFIGYSLHLLVSIKDFEPYAFVQGKQNSNTNENELNDVVCAIVSAWTYFVIV